MEKRLKKKSKKVPKELEDIYSSITKITDKISQEHLNDEYAEFIQYAVAELCRKRPSPLLKGNLNIWACAIIHAIGVINFLDDSSQTPHMKASQLYEAFGVKPSTGQTKSKQIRTLLKMSQFDVNWTLHSRMERNPNAWLITLNGFIVDARTQPNEIQEIAYEKGLIPYMPKTCESNICFNLTFFAVQFARRKAQALSATLFRCIRVLKYTPNTQKRRWNKYVIFSDHACIFGSWQLPQK